MTRYRRSTPSALRVLIAAVVLAGLAVAAPSAPAGATTGKISGAFSPGGPSAVSSFSTWRNAPVALTHVFAPSSSWSDIEMPSTFANYWGGSAYRSQMMISYPMLPSSGAPTMADAAAGAYDNHWRTAATHLVSAGMGNAVLRIGWELNGGWFTWSAKPSPSNYANYFRHIVTAMRSVTGQSFKFVWSVSNGYFGWDPRTAYPGNAYVDYIGDGLYDLWYKHPATPQDRWNFVVNYTNAGKPAGLGFWTNYAQSMGKPLVLPEWGLVNADASMTGGSGGGGDDPYFVEQVYNWVTTHDVAFELYFNSDANDGHHRIDNGQFPIAATDYTTRFGA